jgi:hypothetical protein
MNLYKLLIKLLLFQFIFTLVICDVCLSTSNKDNKEHVDGKKISPNYDMTKGVMIGLAISFITNYLSVERISMFLDKLSKFVKNDVKNSETTEEKEKGIIN